MKGVSARGFVSRRVVAVVLLCVAAAMPPACRGPRDGAPAAPGGAAPPGGGSPPPTPVQGSPSGGEPGSGECELWVTRDYGSAVLKHVAAPFTDGESVMEVLKRHCRVETAYGGGFVKSVDGLASTRGRGAGGGDWFYYVDGVLAGKGALETPAPRGGIVWWDYHAWSPGGGQFQAVVGAWPRPFTGESAILHTAGGAKAAQAIASALKNVGGASAGPGADPSVSVSEYGGGSLSERSKATMLVGVAGELIEYEWVAGLFRNAWRAGIPATIRAPGRDSRLVGLDAAGKEAAAWGEGSGLIVATASYMGDENPLWIVTGWDEQGLDRAADTLVRGVNTGAQLRYAFAVAVTPAGIERLPFGAGPGRD